MLILLCADLTARIYALARMLLRRHHHRHLPSFHARELLDLGDFVEVVLDPHKHVHAELLVRQLAPAEPHRYFDLVALFDELVHAAHLDRVIVVIDARAQLDFLNLDDLLLFAGFVLFLLLFVFELAVIEDFTDGRIGVWRDLHKIEPGIGRHVERFVASDHSHHLTAFVDKTDAHHADLLVDARPLAGGGEVHGWSGYVASPLKNCAGPVLASAQTRRNPAGLPLLSISQSPRQAQEPP